MDKIYVAKVGKTVGLKGQLKLHIDSDFPEQFKKGTSFSTNKNQIFTIESFNTKSNLVKFEGYDDIDTAKKLINKELFTTTEASKEACTLEDNQYFWFDLIGCEIVENDEVLGRIKDIQRLPITDYFEIVTTEDLVAKELPKSFLLPYLDEYILDVNIEEKIIKVSGAKDILQAS